jgi:hypothetical protein
MYIDYKKTVWERIHIMDEILNENEMIKAISDNQQTNSWLWDDCDSEPDREDLLETEEIMTPKDNGGCNTIEVFDDDGNLIWSNGKS